MTSTIGIVCVPSPSGQSGNKHVRKFGSRPLLELVVRRLTDCQRLDRVLVVAGKELDGGPLADLVPPDVPIYLSNRPDSLGRLACAIEATGARAVVRIEAEHPFVDPILIDRLVTTAESHPRCDYIGFCFRDGRPVIHSPLGTFAEWFQADALRRADREAIMSDDRDQITRFFCSRPERFRLRFIPVPAALEIDNVRLSVDDHESWEHAQTIYDWMGPEGLDWRSIAQVLGGATAEAT
ncbi:MAG TPA: NTP transferase domain-containing protein [Pirellulales bacterium]|nr:NTP transferase domain-containing protein [Pirellulales bacterium]